MAPELWNQVLRAVDAADQPGQFLLTGSPVDDAAQHLGGGFKTMHRLLNGQGLEIGQGLLAQAAWCPTGGCTHATVSGG